MLNPDRNRGLDPNVDYAEIYRNLALYDFPWDYLQALSFALFRTYAVPSVGALLDRSGGFADTQKRYDDTGILLEAPVVEAGFRTERSRAAIRRINQMHKMYDITNDDMLYVLATFVVVPKRWIDDYGWRKMTYDEVVAATNYYRDLGKHMNIKDIPATYDEFATLMDDYEAEHFAFDEGARRVADLTLDLLTTFYPKPTKRAVNLFSRALMDDPLLDALRFEKPNRVVRALSRRALRARAAVVRLLPPRRRPSTFQGNRRVKSYPCGFEIAELGTFPSGCPVQHTRADEVVEAVG